jgi:hypothetical protein
MKDWIAKYVVNWELIIGFLLVFIMLAGERGIWGTVEPMLRKVVAPTKAHAPAPGDGRP